MQTREVKKKCLKKHNEQGWTKKQKKRKEMKTMNTMNKNYMASEKRMCFVYENLKVEYVDGKKKGQTNLCSWNNANWGEKKQLMTKNDEESKEDFSFFIF